MYITCMNYVKSICKKYNYTYQQLASLIGYSESAIKQAARTGNISTPLTKAIDLYLETQLLKEELQDYKTLKGVLKSIIKEDKNI